MTRTTSLLLGAAGALAARSAVQAALLAKFRRDVASLNRGDAGPLLAAYAADAVLRFNPGEHRWAGDHVGKPAITRLLADFTAAGVQGELGQLWFSGAPWKISFVIRFDDHAEAPDGTRIYENRTCPCCERAGAGSWSRKTGGARRPGGDRSRPRHPRDAAGSGEPAQPLT